MASHDAEPGDQILAPGRGIARARRHIREQARDGQDGGNIAIGDGLPRIDAVTCGDKR